MHSPVKKPILSIESSCDEMSAAIVQEGKLLSHVVASQEVHAQYGGVVPELAAREHHLQVLPIVRKALEQANVQLKNLGSIAVTQGPGLLGSLLVGTSFANGLALSLKIPLFGIHHMQSHLLANFIEEPYPKFPFLGLTISGGHTQLLFVKDFFDMEVLGTTEDDAVGEAFDKIAKLMGMPYPGGRALDKYAQQGNPERFYFPTTILKGYNFSFSGIKTAFRYFIGKEVQRDPEFIAKHRNDLCASVQATLVKMLLIKVEEAMKKIEISDLVVGGGVANNSGIRSALEELTKIKNGQLFIPAPIYCTDNAAMIGITAYYALQGNRAPHQLLEPKPRFPLADALQGA